MSDFINTIDLLGDDAVIDSIIDKSITEFRDDSVMTIGDRAFHSCKDLIAVCLPNATFAATTAAGYQFQECSSLVDVDISSATAVGPSCFSGCTSLEKIVLPSLNYRIYATAFSGCKALSIVDIHQPFTFYGASQFQSCTALKALILRGDALCACNGTTFNTSGIESGTGWIYVPGNLVNSYRNATNWSTYKDQFRGIVDDENILQGIIDETLVDYENNEITEIPVRAFWKYAPLKSVKSTSINEIRNGAFSDCTNLTIVNLPNVTHIEGDVFAHCQNLSEINLPNLVSLNNRGLTIDAACKVTQLILPSLLEIPNKGICFHTTPITKMEFASVTHICSDGIRYCKNTDKIVLPSVTLIDSNGINNCNGLKALILSGDTMCSLAAADSLTNTGINTGTGYIYVPRALVDSYKAATNWSTYAAQFRALEDYTVDGTTTGELDESKI